MELEKEEEDGKLTVKLDDLTLAVVLNDYVWNQRGINFSAFSRGHPKLDKPEVIIRANNPEKKLKKAADKLIGDLEDLEKDIK